MTLQQSQRANSSDYLHNNKKHRHRSWVVVLALLLLLVPLLSCSGVAADSCPRAYTLTIPEAAAKTHTNGNKLIIAHRGASFHLPEHTIAAYRLALEMGADFVEPDLVATQDGRLIAMHTADLNVTTDIMKVFGDDRKPWFSPHANRTGYWSFNFTLEEIQTLRVKQRLPRARTTAYDGMFSVPTFLEIQQLVQTWNDERVPQILLHVDNDGDATGTISSATTINNNTTTAAPTAATTIPPLPHKHYQQTAGVYAELKSSPWFEKDASMNLVDLLLDEIDGNPEIFRSVLECPAIFKFDDYMVPPLVLQSFEGEALQDFTEKWLAHPSLTISQAPLPPMILLISQHNCWEEGFWFEVGETWRKFVQGVGMDKGCFPKVGEHVEEGQGVKERVEELNLVIHPYTERPEHEFLMEGFQDGLEETLYLFCTVGVQGVFSESVQTAVMAARMGCPRKEDPKQIKEGDGDDDDSAEASETSGSNSNANNDGKETGGGDSNSANTNASACSEDSSEVNLYVALASFVIGAIFAFMIARWVNNGFSCSKRPPRQHQIPCEDNDDGGMEEPHDDELI